MEQYTSSTQTITPILNQMVAYTTKHLAPLFGIQLEGISLPSTSLLREASFSDNPKKLVFDIDSLESTFNRKIGHETTHFLHSVINPKINDRYKTDKEAANLSELVADYGALIFSSENHSEIEQLKRAAIRELGRLGKRLIDILRKNPQSERDLIWNFETHEGGCMAAKFLFKTYGGEYFKEFAHANVKEAKEMLKKLGYWGDLFIPYVAEGPYISVDEDGKPLEILVLGIIGNQTPIVVKNL